MRKVTEADIGSLAAIEATLAACHSITEAEDVLEAVVSSGKDSYMVIRAHQIVCSIRRRTERKALLARAEESRHRANRERLDKEIADRSRKGRRQ